MRSTRRNFLAATGQGAGAVSLLCLAGCAGNRGAFAGEEAGAGWQERIASLERRIPQFMAELRVPGVSVAIIKDARIEWQKGFGVKDQVSGIAVDNDTIFEAQSMSKPVFAYRVMKLCEQGILNLDTPLTKYTQDVFLAGDSQLELVTPRRVLSHTAGFPNWRSKEDPLRINFTPGEKWSYSGEGYFYLQSVVTRLVGHSDPSTCGAYELGIEFVRVISGTTCSRMF